MTSKKKKKSYKRLVPILIFFIKTTESLVSFFLSFFCSTGALLDMKRPSLLLLSYLFIWTVESLDIQHPKLKQKTSDVIPGRYMIEFNQNDLTFFTQSFRQDDTYLKVNHQYNHDFFHGLSININTEDDEAHKNTLESILNRGDVQSVSPVRRIPRPEATVERTGIEANLILPHHMTQVDLVHSELKNKGKGILVGVLDTGRHHEG